MSHRRLEAAIQAGKDIERVDSRSGATYTNFRSNTAVDFDDQKDGVYSVRYSPDGEHIAVGYGDGSIEVLSSSTGMLSRAIKSRYQGTLPVTGLRFNPLQTSGQQFYAVSSDGSVYSCLTSGGEACEKIITDVDNEINCFDFLLDGVKFVISGKDASMKVYDTETAKCVQHYPSFSYNRPDSLQCGHVQRVFALRSHREQTDMFISGGWDNMLKIWDIRTPEGVIRSISGPHLCGDSLDVQGNQILTGSWVATDALQLWDLGSGELIQTLPCLPSNRSPIIGGGDGCHGEFLYCARFASNDVVLAGGSGTNSVQAVDCQNQQVIGDIHLFGAIQALDIHRHAVCIGGTGTRFKLASLT